MLIDTFARYGGIVFAVATLLTAGLALYWRARLRTLARERYIREYVFPPGLMARLAKRRPELAAKDRHLVSRALRQFFLAYLKGGRRFVAMPSQVTDDLWHEFILYTLHYQEFCKQAFGGMLHHLPAAVLGANRRDNTGLRRVWTQCCREENIDPRNPSRLPLLFAIDAKLDIADGFRYSPDCREARAEQNGGVYCGSDFYNSGDFEFESGLDDTAGDASDAAGGDTVGGCGGGCGGGGD